VYEAWGLVQGGTGSGYVLEGNLQSQPSQSDEFGRVLRLKSSKYCLLRGRILPARVP